MAVKKKREDYLITDPNIDLNYNNLILYDGDNGNVSTYSIVIMIILISIFTFIIYFMMRQTSHNMHTTKGVNFEKIQIQGGEYNSNLVMF